MDPGFLTTYTADSIKSVLFARWQHQSRRRFVLSDPFQFQTAPPYLWNQLLNPFISRILISVVCTQIIFQKPFHHFSFDAFLLCCAVYVRSRVLLGFFSFCLLAVEISFLILCGIMFFFKLLFSFIVILCIVLLLLLLFLYTVFSLYCLPVANKRAHSRHERLLRCFTSGSRFHRIDIRYEMGFKLFNRHGINARWSTVPLPGSTRFCSLQSS